MALDIHSEVQKQTSGCVVCGQPYEEVLQEVTTEYLQHTAERGETVCERHLKVQTIIVRAQSGVKDFYPRGKSQAAACDGIVYRIDHGSTNQVAQGNFLLLF